jgi:hypothetical protein
VLPSKTHVVAAVRELQLEVGLPLSNDDLQLVRHETVQITLPNNKKQHASIFTSPSLSGFIASHLRTLVNIEAAVTLA